ncbi:MAG: hypothetical protein WBZ37_14290, partial [Mycobacterium sp.]
MTKIGRSKVALRVSAGLFVLTVACGAALGGVAQRGPTPGTSATGAIPPETPVPPTTSSGPTAGGALIVAPAGAGMPSWNCILGMNC